MELLRPIMKKKVRKYAEGGNPNISEDVRERARRFAALADDPAAQEAMLRSQAGREYGLSGEEPPKLPPPSRAASQAAPAQRPAYPTSQRMADAASASYAGDFEGAGAPREFEPAKAAAALNAATRSMGADSTPRVGRAGQAAGASAASKQVKKEAEADMLEREMPKPRASNIQERAYKAVKERGPLYSRGKSDEDKAEEAKAKKRKEMQSRQEEEEKDTGIGMRKSLLDTERRTKDFERKQERPNYPTAARVKEQRPRAFSSKIESSPRARALAERKKRERDTARGSVQGESFKSGGMVGSASKRADGIATKGKTRGRIY
jgi:hypothetical protein